MRFWLYCVCFWDGLNEREQYEKVFDELGEIRDSEFEALASAYDEIVDAAKDEYVSHVDADEYTETAVAEELGSKSVSDYVDSALLEGMDDDSGSHTGTSGDQFQ